MKAFQVLYVLCFTRQRYHVSVYRTTGPLVFNFHKIGSGGSVNRKIKKLWPKADYLAPHVVEKKLVEQRCEKTFLPG